MSLCVRYYVLKYENFWYLNSKEIYVFVINHVKCVFKDDVSTTFLVFWFADFEDFVPLYAQLFICHAAFNSAFYTGNTNFECNKIVYFRNRKLKNKKNLKIMTFTIKD